MERKFKGAKNFAGDGWHVSNKAREKSETGKKYKTMDVALGDTREIALAAWEIYRSTPTIVNDGLKYADITGGGKYSVNDVVFVCSGAIGLTENSGKQHTNCVLYFPQVDAVRLVGSTTSLHKRIDAIRKKI